MKFNRFRYFSLVVILLVSFVGSAEAFTLHPSFDRTPVKIMDTPDCTYFLVHQQIYDKSKPTYNFPSLTLFRLCKGEERILPLSRCVRLSDSDMRIVEYLPYSDLLMIGYADGGVDMVRSNGSVITLNYFRKQGLPGLSVIRGVMEDAASRSIWISTDGGYVEIDAWDFNIISKTEIGQVSAAFRCGGRIIILYQSSIWESRLDTPVSMSDFECIGGGADVARILFLDENSFVYVKGEPGNEVQLVKMTKSDNGWDRKILCRDAISALAPDQTVNDRYEGNFTPTRGGYLITSAKRILRLSNNNLEEIESIPLGENMSPVGSWDFENFYTYRNRGKFVKRHYDKEWNDVGVAMRPDAPASFISTHLSYSPEVGTMTINHGATQRLFNTSFINPVLLSSWDGIRWSTPNQVYKTPEAISVNPAYKAIYDNRIDRYPVPDPTGMAVDPLNPRHVMISSIFGGLAIVDATNPDRLPIKFCSPADPFAYFPGSIPCFPDQNWDSFASLSSPVFDADGTAWCSYCNFKGSEATGEGKLQMKYLTADRRNALIEAEPDKIMNMDNWGTLSFPFYNTPHCFSIGIAFKHPVSRNFVMISSQNWGQGLAIINHKGTLEDTSDDEMHLACGYITPEGSKRKFVYAIDMIEDEATGELLVADFESVVRFSPPFSVDDEGYLRGEVLKLDGEDVASLLPESCNVNKLSFDSFHRLWIGTNSEGLICVSSDRKRIEKRYTKQNGGLPSNQIYGMVWNPELGSLMVSTKVGLAEIFPDASSDGTVAGDYVGFDIYPKRIGPDYNGPLHLRNLPQNAEILVRNNAGTVVRRIENGPHRYLGYDLEDNNGERLPSGRYTVEVGDQVPIEFLIVS